jgi:hypothetical protein
MDMKGQTSMDYWTSAQPVSCERAKSIKQGRPYQVTVRYDGPYGARGTLLSRHSTYALAKRAARQYLGGYAGIAIAN